jgi:hypothetical protein
MTDVKWTIKARECPYRGPDVPPSNVSTRRLIERRFPSVCARTFGPSEVAKKFRAKCRRCIFGFAVRADNRWHSLCR